MSKTYILEADPTRCGGIQQFVRSLAGYLSPDRTFLLAYYRDLTEEKTVPVPLIRLNGGGKPSGVYLSGSPWRRNFALLCSLFRIRRNLARLLKDGDTLVVNSASALLFFCSRKILRNNRIILIQHTAPRMMFRRAFDFGGMFRKRKIALFERYVDVFVLLSPYEKMELGKWLPLQNKHCPVIRHAVSFPEAVPEDHPPAAASLARLVPLKRIDRVIAAARLLPNITFNIYGSGPEEDSLKKAATGLKNVFFRGYTDDIDAVFRDNTLLLITSEYEGYNISGIEACVHGRPVIVLDTYPAARDLVTDHESGIVLDDFSPEALTGAITEILDSPGRYRDGALKHRELYDPEKIKTVWRELIEEDGKSA